MMLVHISIANRWEETYDIIIKNAMALNSWETICRKLLDDAAVAEYSRNPRLLGDKLYRILVHWRSRVGEKATRARLAECLRAMDLNGCSGGSIGYTT